MGKELVDIPSLANDTVFKDAFDVKLKRKHFNGSNFSEFFEEDDISAQSDEELSKDGEDFDVDEIDDGLAELYDFLKPKRVSQIKESETSSEKGKNTEKYHLKEDKEE